MTNLQFDEDLQPFEGPYLEPSGENLPRVARRIRRAALPRIIRARVVEEEATQSIGGYLDSCPKLKTPERWYSEGLDESATFEYEWDLGIILARRTVLTTKGPTLHLRLYNTQTCENSELRLSPNDSTNLIRLARVGGYLDPLLSDREDISLYTNADNKIVGISIP